MNNDDGTFYHFEIEPDAINGYCKEVTILVVPYNEVIVKEIKKLTSSKCHCEPFAFCHSE